MKNNRQNVFIIYMIVRNLLIIRIKRKKSIDDVYELFSTKLLLQFI